MFDSDLKDNGKKMTPLTQRIAAQKACLSCFPFHFFQTSLQIGNMCALKSVFFFKNFNLFLFGEEDAKLHPIYNLQKICICSSQNLAPYFLFIF